MTRILHPRTSPRSGFTLIELMVFVGLLALLVLSMTRAGEGASRLFETSVSRVTLEQEMRHALERLSQELEVASLKSFDGSVELPLYGNQLTFDRIEDVDDKTGAPTWRTLRVELRPEDGETYDGTDEDGDGIVDEGKLVLIRDPDTVDALEVVLCRHVREYYPGETWNGVDDNDNGMIDETGFAFYVDGSTIHLYLALEGVDSEGRIVTRSLNTALRTRN